MAVLGVGNGLTTFTYWEYQLLMLCLAGVIGMGVVVMEYAMKRLQVMPVLFPGMFSIREHKFFFFDFEVREVHVAEKLRAQAKMLVRMTLFVVLSYLWQHCVLQTSQSIGTEFPREQCNSEHDCFSSDFHVTTFFNRQHEPVDCSDPKPFDTRVVVSCIRFVKPTATEWLKHIAIAHSVTQLNHKSYEVFVWLAGNSRCLRSIIGALAVVTFALFLSLFFAGVVTEFVASWLSFVMSFSMPVFLWTVWTTSGVCQAMWVRQSREIQQSIEENLQAALKELPGMPAASAPEGIGFASSSLTWQATQMAAQMSKRLMQARVGFSSMLEAVTPRRRTVPPDSVSGSISPASPSPSLGSPEPRGAHVPPVQPSTRFLAPALPGSGDAIVQSETPPAQL